MTQQEIIEMAKQAGMVVVNDKFSLFHFLELFAKLVAAKEREACANAADEHMRECEGKSFGVGAAIRARGEA